MDIKERATRVKILLLDVDGVLTDGRLYYTSQGEEIKVFNVKDGLGIKLAQRANIRIGVISGRKSLALINRLEELGIEEIHLGLNNKLPILEEILGRLSLKYENVAFLGDDYVDLPVLRRVGFPMVVADSPEELKRHAIYVTKAKGGEGAVREAIEFLLKQRGQWEEAVKHYYA
ncbi:MAG: HAD hydrolase family protein [Aquificaceae bacterium]|nr:HAD hydrolase family protein [Aquificaceae bacterium]MDW8067231.1 HAD hydrolase family protein [Aquificaceae bacterium]MDW8422880.1 HAD hydrolase family protein [Aquificaceae bacterium]